MFTAKDEATTRHMLAARDHAAKSLEVSLTGEDVAWGWYGRSVGCKVAAHDGMAWLRVRAVPAGDGYGRLWDGNVSAAHALPAAVRRPLLMAWRDFTAEGFDYRAELFEYVPSRVCAPEQFLREPPALTSEWWATLRKSLTALSAVTTDRIVVSERYITEKVPYYLDAPDMPTTPPRWAASHGDLHWANLTVGGPRILDWETWGMAPAGYDVAQLAAFTMFAPATQARLREELASFLDTPEGRFAELVVLAELLHMTTNGHHTEAADDLLRRARALVGFCRRVDW